MSLWMKYMYVFPYAAQLTNLAAVRSAVPLEV